MSIIIDKVKTENKKASNYNNIAAFSSAETEGSIDIIKYLSEQRIFRSD